MTIEPAPLTSPDYLSRLANSLPSMLAYWDPNLLCRYANRAYERWFGVAPASLLGTSLRDLLGPALFKLNEPHILGALRGEAQSFERDIPGPNGVVRSSLAHYIPDVVDGQVRGFAVEVVEITRLKQTEAALHRSEQAFRSLSDCVPFVIFHADAGGNMTYLSAPWRDLSGRKVADGLGKAWQQWLHLDDLTVADTAFHTATTTGRDVDCEVRLLRPDGEVRTVRMHARLVPPGAQGPAGLVGAMEDVTERRQVMERLRASESFLDRTGRIAAVGGWQVDLRDKTLTWTRQTCRIHGVDEHYQPTFDAAINFYAPEARPIIEAAALKCVADGTPWDLKLPLITAAGRRIWVRAQGEVEYDNGQPVRLIGAFQDITDDENRARALEEEHALRMQVEQQLQTLDRLLNERGEMLDVLAHEVRQPLNNASAALQSAHLALEEVGESVASSRLRRAQDVMGQIQASLDNTLAVANLLARPDPIHRVDTDIDTLLAVAIADMSASERWRIRVEQCCDARTASMDMSLLRLALRNLLANALKFSPAGSPVIVRLTDCDDPLGLLIDVINTGPGIADALVPHLFQRGIHARLGATGVSPGRGLGLGLYIVRRVMELHGGQVQLHRNGPDGVTLRLVIGPPEAEG